MIKIVLWSEFLKISLVLIFLFCNDQGNHSNIINKGNRCWETSNQKYPEQHKSTMYITVLNVLYQI